MHAETPKNAIKKMGWGEGFSRFFEVSPIWYFPPLQHGKKWSKEWEWACLDAKINAKPWVKTPTGKALLEAQRLALVGGQMCAFFAVTYM